MLGRLFKLKSLLGVGENTNSTQTQTYVEDLFKATAAPEISQLRVSELTTGTGNANANSFEDSYTREILYGSLDLALHPLPFNPRRFRLVVSQDGGHLRSKQVLYDSAIETSECPSLRTKSPDSSMSSCSTSLNPRIPPAPNTLRGLSPGNSKPMAKNTHNIDDLNDYMFGRGLPSVERHTSTKIHMLPPLSLLVEGMCLAVLLTKLFLISSLGSGESSVTMDPEWAPHATFPSKDTVFQVVLLPSKASCSSPELTLLGRSCQFSSRFAVGFVIPLEDAKGTVEEVLTSNWKTLSYYLIILQKLVCKKLTVALKASLTCSMSPYINNKRIVFPCGVLQPEAEFAYHLQKLVKLVQCNVNTPRLVSINAFMTYSLNHVDSKLKSSVMNWALEVINWLEFKDGRNFSPFHSQGPAIPQMHSQNSYLLHSSSSATSWYRPNENALTTNTFLATLIALILPLRALLSAGPLHVDPNSTSDSKTITRIVVMTSNSSVAKKLIFILSGLIPDAELLQRLEHEGTPSSHTTPSNPQGVMNKEETLLNDDNKTPKYRPTVINLDKTASQSSHDGGISFTAKPIAAEPIPIGLVASEVHSDDSASVSLSSTKGWDVPNKAAVSLSLHGNKTPVGAPTVTIAQQIPIARRVSASNTSSMAYLSSSLNSSLSSSASNYSLSRLGSSFMEKWKTSLVSSNKLHQSLMPATLDGAVTSDTLNLRPSFATTKSPSPADELDEPTWELPQSGHATGSPIRHRFSRTQSLIDLFNETSSKKSGLSTSALGVDRTRTSIYVPPFQNDAKDADDANREIITRKVERFMQSKLLYRVEHQKRLLVDPVKSKSGNSACGKMSTKSKEHDVQESSLDRLHKRAILQPNVAFVDEFRPEYTIQSCPVNPRLESQVTNAMKNDLLFYQNNCGYEKVTSQTVYISLRAREIKLIEMSVGDQRRSHFGTGLNTPISPPAAIGEAGNSYFAGLMPQSPISLHFPGADYSCPAHDKNGHCFRTNVRKVYTPNRNSGEKDAIQHVEGQLKKLNEVASLINSNSTDSPETKELYNRLLFNAVRELIT